MENQTLKPFNPIIEFKTHNLAAEFLSPLLDGRLVRITYSLAGFVYFNFGKTLELTEIFRTQEMQDRYYSGDPAYKIKPWQSVHQFWRAVDASVQWFSESEIAAIQKYMETFVYDKPGLVTCLVHEVGGMGRHCHLQVDSARVTRIRTS